ncbi:MAG TPA: DUF2442 domain-containing protein [Bacteroidia bacterium]|nr:DUF2442 domain-containing protein [Bacteroidia bacterium]
MNNYIGVRKVKPVEDYKLLLTFSNGEQRLFDMKPFLNKGIFKELRDMELFQTAHVSFDTVGWDNDADFDPEVLYMDSKRITGKKYTPVKMPLSSAAEPRAKYRRK